LRTTPREGKALHVLSLNLSHTRAAAPVSAGRAPSRAGSSGTAVAQRGAPACWVAASTAPCGSRSSCSPSGAGAHTAGCCRTPFRHPAQGCSSDRDETPNLRAKGQKRKKKADTGQVRVFFVTLLYVTSHNCCHRNIMQGTLMVWLYGVLHVPKSHLKYLVKRNLAPPLVLHRAGSYC